MSDPSPTPDTAAPEIGDRVSGRWRGRLTVTGTVVEIYEDEPAVVVQNAQGSWRACESETVKVINRAAARSVAGTAAPSGAWASTRDATSYDRPNTRSPKRYHVADENGMSRCAKQLLVENQGQALVLADVPVHLRCMRNGCEQGWAPAGSAPAALTDDMIERAAQEFAHTPWDKAPEDLRNSIRDMARRVLEAALFPSEDGGQAEDLCGRGAAVTPEPDYDDERLASYARNLSPNARLILTGADIRMDAVTVNALQQGGLLDDGCELTEKGRRVVALLPVEGFGGSHGEEIGG